MDAIKDLQQKNCTTLVYMQSKIYTNCQTIKNLFKKKNKTLESFWVGSAIAFQQKDKEWQKGEIVSIKNDSFSIRPVVVQYNLLTTDTLFYNIARFSLSDIYAMPKKGVLIDYKDG